MNRKFTIISVMLSLFLFLGAAFVPIRVEAAYGSIGNWTGNLSVGCTDMFSRLIYKDNFSYSNNSGVGDVTVDSYYSVYEFHNPIHFTLDGFVPGYSYSGSVKRKVDFLVTDFQAPVDSIGQVSCTLDEYNLDGINIIQRYAMSTADTCTLEFELVFDDFVPQSDTLKFDVGIYLKFSLINNANSNLYLHVKVADNAIGDTAGILNYYTDLRDVPSYNGLNADQNQQIIDGIEENTGVLENLINNLSNWFEVQKNNINTRFTELTSNLTSWYNGLTDTINNGIDRLLTSYTGTGTTEAAGKFDDSAGELQTVESDLTGITNSGINDYSTAAFDTSIITTLGPSLVYVVTWFTNFWNMGGIFTSLLNVGLALFVAFFILRLTGGSD